MKTSTYLKWNWVLTLVLFAFFMPAMAQKMLPDWVLTPPFSPNNSCIYSLGISDPGLNKTDAYDQALSRAKCLLNTLLLKSKPNKMMTIIMDGKTEVISKNLLINSYHGANFEVGNTFYTEFNEAIVQLKYSFVDRPGSVKRDSVFVKSVLTFYSATTANSSELNLEFVASCLDIHGDICPYYSLNQKNGKDSLVSLTTFTNRELNPDLTHVICTYSDQQNTNAELSKINGFKHKYSAGADLKKGLWYGYLMCLNQADNTLNLILNEEIKDNANQYAGSIKVIKEIFIQNNRLQVALYGTNYAKGFITTTKP